MSEFWVGYCAGIAVAWFIVAIKLRSQKNDRKDDAKKL